MALIPDFDRLYAEDPDPWDVATSWYEQRKIDVVLACLRRRRYRLAWDAACGTGELAARLAARCDRVVASDLSGQAVALSRARLAHAPAVVVEQCAVPDRPHALDAAPDLVVLSEFLYYLDDDARRSTYALLDDICSASTDVLAVHWAFDPDDACLSGARAQRELDEHLVGRRWSRLVTHTDVEFLVALWSRDTPAVLGR